MAKKISWSVNERQATSRGVQEAVALERQTRAKRAKKAREDQQMDANARAVGRALRKQVGMPIACKPPFVSGRQEGGKRERQFELALGLVMPVRLSASRGGTSSFHFKLTPRGLGTHRKNKGKGYRRGEAVKAIRYIMRELAREIEDGGIVSNISNDADVLATVFNALEELETTAGRDNANVFNSLVVSLPAELNAQQRELALKEICYFLDEHGLSYAGVLHKPDPEGDQRNYHAHIIFSWRPLAYTPDGCSFAAGTLGALNTPEFIYEFRDHTAWEMNEAMRKAGFDRRFTAEKTRLGPGSSNYEKHGPGRKHADRRTERAALAETERAWLVEAQTAAHQLAEASGRWLLREFVDHMAAFAELTKRDQEIAAEIAARAIAAKAASASALKPARQVSHEKPDPVELAFDAADLIEAAATLQISPPSRSSVESSRPDQVAKRVHQADAIGSIWRALEQPARAREHGDSLFTLGSLRDSGTLNSIAPLSAAGAGALLSGVKRLALNEAIADMANARNVLVGSETGPAAPSNSVHRDGAQGPASDTDAPATVQQPSVERLAPGHVATPARAGSVVRVVAPKTSVLSASDEVSGRSTGDRLATGKSKSSPTPSARRAERSPAASLQDLARDAARRRVDDASAALQPLTYVVNRRPKRTPYRRPKGTPFVEQRYGYDGCTVRAGCGVGRA